MGGDYGGSKKRETNAGNETNTHMLKHRKKEKFKLQATTKLDEEK